VADTGALTRQADDFPRWYQDVVSKAEMADNGPVRGTMVIRPYGYAIWERMQAELDQRIKACGARNAYFPLFIPQSYFAREAEHVEGFSPELAVVTFAGGEQLAEPVVVRPTSETVVGEFMAKWVQSYRDLPLLLNQWSNVVRWELRPRLFLRSSEFLWQEGHCAHATYDDAAAYARRIHLEVYDEFLRDVMAVPTFLGIKPSSERFPGAINSITAEGMMRDGKALQMATSHEMGQNFARAFDIYYQSEAGESTLCWTTSWGASTRLVGGLVMGHGDDRGLLVPPRLAAVQVVVLGVRDEPEVTEAVAAIAADLARAGVRVEVDRGRGSFGRRVTDWEIKGVPLRVEVGPRDLKDGTVSVVRRDTGAKSAPTRAALAVHVAELLESVQSDLYQAALAYRDDHTVDVATIAEAHEAAQTGFARLAWGTVDGDGEAALRADAVTVRALQRADGSIPDSDTEEGLVCVVGKAY
jgi:prolyl-tRNA synthetase